MSEIQNYFIEDINQRKSCDKKLSKYVAAFNSMDKILIVLSATTGGVSIISITTIVGAPVGIASASFTSIFSLSTGIINKLLNITRKKKEKHDKILMLSKSKLSSIETLISLVLIVMDISYEEFITVLKEKNRYKMMKDNLRNENGESYEILRFNSVKSKILKKIITFLV